MVSLIRGNLNRISLFLEKFFSGKARFFLKDIGFENVNIFFYQTDVNKTAYIFHPAFKENYGTVYRCRILSYFFYKRTYQSSFSRLGFIFVKEIEVALKFLTFC